MPKYLDPKADVVFKKIFGDHPHLLISFLNAVLPLPLDRPIVSIEYLPSEQVPVIPAFKRTIADVKCKDKLGRIFIVEMQIDWTDSFKQRLLFGASSAFVKQLNKSQAYQFLQPVYGLGIIADSCNEENLKWYHHYRLVNDGDTGDVIEHLQLIFIELPKFQPNSREEKQLRLLWLRFLREINEATSHVSEELLSVPEIYEAVELAQESAYTLPELSAYEVYWDSVRSEKTLLQGRHKEGEAIGMVKGRMEGEALGVVKGRIEGEAIGVIKGRMEGEALGVVKGRVEERIAMARELKKQNIDLLTIERVTSLTKKELEDL